MKKNLTIMTLLLAALLLCSCARGTFIPYVNPRDATTSERPLPQDLVVENIDIDEYLMVMDKNPIAQAQDDRTSTIVCDFLNEKHEINEAVREEINSKYSSVQYTSMFFNEDGDNDVDSDDLESLSNYLAGGFPPVRSIAVQCEDNKVLMTLEPPLDESVEKALEKSGYEGDIDELKAAWIEAIGAFHEPFDLLYFWERDAEDIEDPFFNEYFLAFSQERKELYRLSLYDGVLVIDVLSIEGYLEGPFNVTWAGGEERVFISGKNGDEMLGITLEDTGAVVKKYYVGDYVLSPDADTIIVTDEPKPEGPEIERPETKGSEIEGPTL
jgi:hypothetical protein